MVKKTGIQWTERTWNPLRGCSKISPGCANCYAITTALRYSKPGQPFEGFVKDDPPNWTGLVQPLPKKLFEPLGWREPATVFVDSMTDLFHEDVPDNYIAAVFGVMAATPQHTYQVLTKRAERVEDWFMWMARQPYDASCTPLHHIIACSNYAPSDRQRKALYRAMDCPWPLPNVWLGVSVEDQVWADRRIPDLLSTPAAVRFLSCEPLLEQVALSTQFADGDIHWVIVGGESGPLARPLHVEWVRNIVATCKTYRVPVFVKQLGANVVQEGRPLKLRDKKGGDSAEWPEDLRVRQMPEVVTESIPT